MQTLFRQRGAAVAQLAELWPIYRGFVLPAAAQGSSPTCELCCASSHLSIVPFPVISQAVLSIKPQKGPNMYYLDKSYCNNVSNNSGDFFLFS